MKERERERGGIYFFNYFISIKFHLLIFIPIFPFNEEITLFQFIRLVSWFNEIITE